MRTVAAVVMAVGLAASAVSAEGLYIGGFGAMPTGGDTEDPEMGGGGLIGIPVNDNLAIEAAGLTYDDLDGELQVIVGTLSLKLSTSIADNLHVYAIGGGSYIQPDDLEETVGGVTAKVEFDGVVGYHFGAGAELFLNENLGIFGDYTHTVSELEGETTVSGGGMSASEDLEEADYEFGMVRAGLKLML